MGDSRDSRRRGSPRRGRGGDSPRDRRRRRGSADSNSDRDDRKSSRRDTRRGGRDEDDMVQTMIDIFKDLVIVHEMIKNETEEMRGHKSMSRSKKYYHGDARLDRRLKEGRTPADTLNNLAKGVKEVKDKLNKDYRKIFLKMFAEIAIGE